MIALSLVTCLALAQASPTSAPTSNRKAAVASEASAPAPATGRFFLAPKVGFFKSTTPLNGALFLAADLGLRLPVMENRLTLVAEFNYHQPDVQGTLSDPQVLAGGGAGEVAYKLTEREMALLLSLIYRFEGTLTPYVGAGPGLYLHRAQADALDTTVVESEGTLGFQVVAGVEYQLGPGGLFAEAHYHFTQVGFLSTGNVNIGGFLAGSAGYRFHF